MSLQILVDMNLSPKWVDFFKKHSIDSKHWSQIGDYNAADKTIMQWARDQKYIVFTNDLDFGTLLALTQASVPSVIQMRTQNVLPEYLGVEVVSVIREYSALLEKGALIVLDETTSRIRILPLN